jgi:hypothetical protein
VTVGSRAFSLWIEHREQMEKTMIEMKHARYLIAAFRRRS